MNSLTGGNLGESEHIAQSIADILTTRIGTRVMRREYGSLLPDLIDHPANDVTRLRAYAATAMALARWEPRILMHRVQLQSASLQGQAVMDIECTVVDTNEPLKLSVPLQLGAIV
ncbi:GPW/gp25 family protein [Pseudomonas kurunegalensis]|uniref:GPW/gp25 family protein n=1 Tax=Pseudomonas kurunegalensis TaxID=485880 RepID=UPI00256FC29B|nr:GPW/gp25 family protein [Pseudomonas kurunegalensis]WJD60882.1 GPW/gp25 family protein [Pseudomonas kurunegalensis]